MTRNEALETSYMAWLHDRPLSLDEFMQVAEHFIPEELEGMWEQGWVWDFVNDEVFLPTDGEEALCDGC